MKRMKPYSWVFFAFCIVVLLLIPAVAGIYAETLTEEGKQLAKYDLNGDGKITIADVASLLDYLSTSCGHEAVAFPEKEASCREPGSTGGSYCKLCDAVLTRPVEIPIKDHDWQETVGEAFKTCKGCGMIECDVKGHSYADGVCTVCKEKVPSEGLEYALNEDGTTWSVVGIGSCRDTDIVIPALHEGMPVTAVGDYAFKMKETLTSLTIGRNVKQIGVSAFSYCSKVTDVTYLGKGDIAIGDWAFNHCRGLKKVTIPDNVKSIGAYAFYRCYGLESISLGSGITQIKESLFGDCTSLESITVPDTVRSIEKNAFYGCTALSAVDLGKGLLTIDEYAFEGCSALKSITVPDSVTCMGENVFYDCTGLTSVTLPFIGASKDGPFKDAYEQQFNYVFNAGGIIYFDALRTVVITGGTTVWEDAFLGCDTIVSLTLPAGVTEIGSY
ncbi:MAG: leucine-rich repeat protein, partial [Clostridia bacterium]|nr:leucine-rich repeat protein [Clostridia bacterium]